MCANFRENLCKRSITHTHSLAPLAHPTTSSTSSSGDGSSVSYLGGVLAECCVEGVLALPSPSLPQHVALVSLRLLHQDRLHNTTTPSVTTGGLPLLRVLSADGSRKRVEQGSETVSRDVKNLLATRTIWFKDMTTDKIIFQAQAAKRVEERSWRRRRILQTVQWHRRTYFGTDVLPQIHQPMDFRFQSVDKLPSQGSGVATNQEKALSSSTSPFRN